jgi:hypothetical protein
LRKRHVKSGRDVLRRRAWLQPAPRATIEARHPTLEECLPMNRKPLATVLRSFAIAATALAAATAQAGDEAPRRAVDLVLALDVSGSMNGLIESAKQRLWDVTNELARAQPVPELRVALLTYGNPAYGEQSGYVKVDLPFTSDLDAVNERLFAFRTNGGDEYVARVIHTSLERLHWSTDDDALKVIFVAGNESAAQDPRIAVEHAVEAAAARGIVVNAIYCGPDGDSIARSWQLVAYGSNGVYAYIDQNRAAVAAVATPLDDALVALNAKLNATYVPFGTQGAQGQQGQQAQDRNAERMSPQAAASRAVTKGGSLYQTSWDLVDAVAGGTALADVAVGDLPAELRALSDEERSHYVQTKSEERAQVKAEIAELAEARREFLEEERRQAANGGAAGQPEGLDAALLRGIRETAESQGFTFPKN